MTATNAKYLVTGASGQYGAFAVEALLKTVPAANIVALVRRSEAAAPLEAKGVEVRIGDYSDLASLEKAFAGIDRLLFVSTSAVGDERVAQHANVVEAAKKVGVGFIAYTSILKAGQVDFSLSRQHQLTEETLAATGIPYAFLRNSWYTENNMAAVPVALQYGAVMGAAGDGRISGATRKDYAEAAAAVITADAPAPNAVYELAGDESYSLADLAAEISRLSGKPVAYNSLSEADYKAALLDAGLPEPVADMLADSDAAAAKGALEDNSKTLSGLIGRPTTPWTETLAAEVQQQKAA